MEQEIQKAFEKLLEMLFDDAIHPKWSCLNTQINTYDINTFSQKNNIVKYRLDLSEGKLAAVILTEDKANGEINLEMIFLDDPENIYEIPANEKNKSTLKKLLNEIEYWHTFGANTRFVHSLLPESILP